jgi:uncharacterized membrane protein YkoI
VARARFIFISSERADNAAMNVKLKRGILAAAAVAALGLGGAALAGATGGGDDGGGKGDDGSGKPITGTALERASAVALDHTGGGRVSDTEVQDEEGYYEVEVTRGDGSQVDVHLDSHFNVLNESADGEGDDAD